jgi:hypothetical protein
MASRTAGEASSARSFVIRIVENLVVAPGRDSDAAIVFMDDLRSRLAKRRTKLRAFGAVMLTSKEVCSKPKNVCSSQTRPATFTLRTPLPNWLLISRRWPRAQNSGTNTDEKTDRRSPVHLVTGDDQIKQKTEERVRHGLESIRRKLETIQGARQGEVGSAHRRRPRCHQWAARPYWGPASTKPMFRDAFKH